MTKTVVLDSGHGGWDKGATAIDGKPEAVFNWDLSKALGDYLTATYDVKVIYTHEGAHTALTKGGNVGEELFLRAKVANDAKADLLVSIHHDSHGNPSVRGGSLWVWTDKRDEKDSSKLAWLTAPGNHKAPRSYAMAQQVQPLLATAAAAAGIPWRSTIMCADFGILRACNGPCMLVEAFMGSNKEDTAAARRPEFIPTMAKAVAEGIAQAIGLERRPPSWDPAAEIARLRERGIINTQHDPFKGVTWGEVATALNRIMDRIEKQ